MNAGFFRRIGAYIIDVLIITIVTSMLGTVLPNNQKVVKASNEQMDLLSEFSEAISRNDQDSIDRITNEINDLSYEFSKLSVYSNLSGIILYFLYFIVFQRYNNGQTVGKKLLKIETIDGNGEVAGFKQLLIRGLILYSIAFDFLDIICLFIFKQSVYMNVSSILSWIRFIIFAGCIFTMMFSGRGLHDRVCGTSVIMVGSYKDDEEEDKVSSWKKTSEKAKRVNEYKGRHTSGKKKGMM